MNFKKAYRDLETQVMAHLRNAIMNSGLTSKHMDAPVIEIDLFGYTELAIVNDRLTFICDGGLHYSLFADATLEDLIDLIEKLD